ncbi:MAG: hypothetical protein ACFFDW_09040 [Candidatus Thorarchaeota archaeon]
MSMRKVRDLRHYHEYEYDSETKDMIEDLLTKYPNVDEIISKAIEALHELHFGSAKTGKPPKYSETLATKDEVTSSRLDILYDFVQSLKDQNLAHSPPQAGNKPVVAQLTDEANLKIISKIDELGMKFNKILTQDDNKGGKQTVTAEMSHEEIIQLIKRIDQLESKLTHAISQSRVAAATGPTRRGGPRDIAEPPQVTVKKIDGPIQDVVERPLLDDVLDTVIVSVDNDE